MGKFFYFTTFVLLVLFSWTWFSGFANKSKPKTLYKKGHYIDRLSGDRPLKIASPEHIPQPQYSWNTKQKRAFPTITKEFFRCRGSILHPQKSVEQEGKEPLTCFDCGGMEKHSLPIHDGNEFIYPILIDLLNYVQEKAQKRVMITSGHCCPQHNTYNNPSVEYRNSKHQIGAEVDFYVKGLEYSPEEIASLLMQYYYDTPKYEGHPEYFTFSQDGDTKTNSWQNKEVLIKVFDIEGGRDFDNQHLYPYISIQVCYDWVKKERVIYSWPQANKSYYRY